jgi:anti-sigma regulatory factor (Ser/Thr protein kinase)
MASVNQRALPEAVPAIRASISDFLDGLGVPSTRSADIQLAVSEAAGNVVRHAYPNGTGNVRCDAVANDGTIVISVSDWGDPFDAATPDPGMGLGMFIMHALADDVTLHATTGAKTVELTFRHPCRTETSQLPSLSR